jgi:hypothetical protein
MTPHQLHSRKTLAAPDIDQEKEMQPHTPYSGRQIGDIPAPNLIWAICSKPRSESRLLNLVCRLRNKLDPEPIIGNGGREAYSGRVQVSRIR